MKKERPKSKHRKTKRRRMSGGIHLSSANTIGAGGYGIVVHSKEDPIAYKLLYDLDACPELQNEITMQRAAHTALNRFSYVGVPLITWTSSEPIMFRGVRYLCGIGMTYLQPPLDFTEQVHIILRNNVQDVDTEWGRRIGEPVSETNPTRGFFASTATLEWIWSQEKSSMTIERMAWIMGSAYRILLDAGVLPTDVEWVWSGGKPWIIDFGLSRFSVTDPWVFLHKHGVEGLADDLYRPQQGDRGYDEFMKGFGQMDI
jgi:hypothetical protein